MKKFMLALVAVSMLMVPGCLGGRLSPATQKQLHGAADTAESRAKSFKMLSPKIKAKDDADADAFKSWVKNHQEGLDSQAKALRHVSNALKK